MTKSEDVYSPDSNSQPRSFNRILDKAAMIITSTKKTINRMPEYKPLGKQFKRKKPIK